MLRTDPCFVRQLFWVYYVCNGNGRSSSVIYNVAITIKLGSNFRLQEDYSLLKEFSKIDAPRAFCHLMECASGHGSGFDASQVQRRCSEKFSGSESVCNVS